MNTAHVEPSAHRNVVQLSVTENQSSGTYSVEIDRLGRLDWEELLSGFDDATLYQSWSYGVARWGYRRISHLVLKLEGEVVGIAQVTIRRLPVLGAGIAYVPWGPLWRKRGKAADPERFRAMVAALKEEYAAHRRHLVRIAPNVVHEQTAGIDRVLRAEGYNRNGSQYRTFYLDLTPPLDAIRKSLDQKWRNQLNRAEKNGLSILEGTSDDLYEKFAGIYREMMGRKKFQTSVDIEVFGEVQRDLPGTQKMQVLVCEHQGLPVAGGVVTAIGDTGIYLLGASSNEGSNLKGSYLLQWRIVQWLKDRGCHQYDLGGIDPEGNPGVYHFKKGLSDTETFHLGQHEVDGSHLAAWVVHGGEKLRGALRKIGGET